MDIFTEKAGNSRFVPQNKNPEDFKIFGIFLIPK